MIRWGREAINVLGALWPPHHVVAGPDQQIISSQCVSLGRVGITHLVWLHELRHATSDLFQRR